VIERFNFYDIYGYLLPGATLLGLLWLPFGIINGSWPAAQLSATVFILGFSYVIGHVLQTIATVSVPSKIKDPNGKMRMPSDRMLDPDDTNLAAKVKSQLERHVKAEFEIDLDPIHTATGSDEISLKRTDAFFLCRALLIRQKIANYTEQFEGLYAMLRGLSMAFGIGAVYLAGWGCSSFTLKCAKAVALAITLISCTGVLTKSLIAAFGRKKASADFWLLVFLLASAFGLGMRFGVARSAGANHLSEMWFGALASLIASVRYYTGYREFAMHFAKGVWRDFVSFKSQPQDDQLRKRNA
jgi:hypothetical protein